MRKLKEVVASVMEKPGHVSTELQKAMEADMRRLSDNIDRLEKSMAELECERDDAGMELFEAEDVNEAYWRKVNAFGEIESSRFEGRHEICTYSLNENTDDYREYRKKLKMTAIEDMCQNEPARRLKALEPAIACIEKRGLRAE